MDFALMPRYSEHSENLDIATESDSLQQASVVGARTSAFSLRVLMIAPFLMIANAWWITEIEYISYSDNCTTQALYFNAIALLLIMLGINAFLRKVRPKWVFSLSEMVSLYVITVIASNLAGHDQLQILFTTITYLSRHVPANASWTTKILPHVPTHLIVSDKEAVSALYQGNSTLYRWDHVQPWLAPLGWWTLFTMMSVWTMLCLVSIFRKQWDAERLNYPIAEIPIEILSDTKSLFSSRLLWIGVVIGATGQIVNMIHSLLPELPSLPIGVQLFKTESFPWSAAGSIPICSFPFAYGLGFLLPTQLGFSVWFFMFFSRAELIGAATMGYTDWGKFPYISQQGVGAIFGMFATILFAAKSHLKLVWQIATRPISENKNASSSPDFEEPMSYRLAVFGLIAGAVGMASFAVAAGMRLPTALLFLGILFVIVIVVARLRAELGLPTFELYQVGADQVMQRVAGTNSWTPNELTVMTLFFWMTRTHRQLPMQNHADAMRLGHRTGTSLSSLTKLILLASFFGTVVAFWAFLHSTYSVGLESAKFRGPAGWAFGQDPWGRLEGWLSSPQKPDTGALGAYVFGCLFSLFLAGMRARFVWWPFHPAGYLVAGSFGLFRLWLPIFVSWFCKVMILRYGGLRAYKTALPFFIGLILGEFSAGFLRTVLDLTFHLHLPPESGIGGL